MNLISVATESSESVLGDRTVEGGILYSLYTRRGTEEYINMKQQVGRDRTVIDNRSHYLGNRIPKAVRYCIII